NRPLGEASRKKSDRRPEERVIRQNDPRTRHQFSAVEPQQGMTMARPPTIVPVAPRVLNNATLCAYLGRSETWLAEHRAELEASGFPKQDPLLGGTDRCAVDLWLDQRSDILRPTALSTVGTARSWDKSR